MKQLLKLLPKTVFNVFPFLAGFAFMATIAFLQLGYPGGTGVEVAFLIIGVAGFALCVKRIYDIRKAYKQGKKVE